MQTDINDKTKVQITGDLRGLNAAGVWKALYGKELNSKKNILEYISTARVLKQAEIPDEMIQETYNFIYNSIDEMGSTIKVNTNMYLKNQLKAEFGKYVKEKDPRPINHFIEFFKGAYPPEARNKEFTWVMTDIRKISDEQIWTTLAYINGWCLKENNRLDENQREDTIKMIELLISRKNIKYINRVKSLEKLINNLNIKILTTKDDFKVKRG